MNEILMEIAVVTGLIFINAFFSGTEMALITLRKSRIKELVKSGNRRAAIVEKLQKKPEEFLATIQVGITLMSVIASAFAGATMSEAIAPLFEKSSISFFAQNAETISFIIIVTAITYFSLVLGELVPKSLGIKFSERFALFAARPLFILSKISFPVTKFLTLSSNLVLKIFKDKTSFSEGKLTEEELRAILYEGHKSGIIEKREHEIFDNIFKFSDIAVAQVMTPRSKIFAVDIDESPEKKLNDIIESSHSRVPFYKEKIDNILGVLHVKDLLRRMGTHGRQSLDFKALLKPPYFVPNTQKIDDLLHRFQKSKTQLALVTNEHGDIDGLVTLEDILEEIVGEISDETDVLEKPIQKQKDGSYLVQGDVSIVDLNKFFKTELPADEQFTTLSGLILAKLEKFPDAGDKVVIDNFEFTIAKKTDRTIESVAVRKIPRPD